MNRSDFLKRASSSGAGMHQCNVSYSLIINFILNSDYSNRKYHG